MTSEDAIHCPVCGCESVKVGAQGQPDPLDSYECPGCGFSEDIPRSNHAQ